ncbi:Ent-kaurene synthase [Apiospora kogelbergensis]|uniref:Ent-kaurene synthase n=1 Tax=Apiospora kogelbergensis TaxID=1337665 RepID=A0AAW0QU76_9PEZI
MDVSLSIRSNDMLSDIASRCSVGSGFGSMSPSIYDTAWISMIRKPDGKYLFPDSFKFLLDHQLPSGAWISYASPIDGILNTAAALLALRQRISDELYEGGLTEISDRAEVALTALLEAWDVSSCDQVGFEVLVIRHLTMLQDQQVTITFPQYYKLQKLYDAKMSHATVSRIYKTRSTFLHSLEGLSGLIDFDRLRCWLEEDGSMMGSPSSTAAYLMYSSVWDERAVAYLERVVANGSGNGDGSVPCAWPTSIFEVAWAVTALMESGASVSDQASCSIAQFLDDALASNTGIVGFSPSFLPDADDTAKVILALHYLGGNPKVEPLIRAFEAPGHFVTYNRERNPSFSANANVLSCLCAAHGAVTHTKEIVKAAEFLCTKFETDDINEKWHIHDLYSTMLLSQSFVHMFSLQQGVIREMDRRSPALLQRIRVISLHILMRTMHLQLQDGSWDGLCEVTAYAILTLASILRLPWMQVISQEAITRNIQRGKSFLESNAHLWSQGSYLWVEKVIYSSPTISEAYCMAAFQVPISRPLMSSTDPSPTYIEADIRKAGQLVWPLPLLSQLDRSRRDMTELQATFAMRQLHRQRFDIMPRPAMAKDKYLAIIPLTWTACNVLHGCSLSLYQLQEMMILSRLQYQVDEFMETTVEGLDGELSAVRLLIHKLCGNYLNDRSGIHEPVPNGLSQEGLDDEDRSRLHHIQTVLGSYTGHIMRHPATLATPASVQERLCFELEKFLLAHVRQSEDNRGRFKCLELCLNGKTEFDKTTPEANGIHKSLPRRTFYDWVRTTSADHTSCPLSFVFFNCLIMVRPHMNAFSSPRTAYAVEDVFRHLASLCRIQNDYGSITRDRIEGNLNSMDFPEFYQGPSPNSRPTKEGDLAPGQSVKDDLLWIADYERWGLDASMARLEKEMNNDKLADYLRLFIHVTDLYGMIYLQKDVSSWKVQK